MTSETIEKLAFKSAGKKETKVEQFWRDMYNIAPDTFDEFKKEFDKHPDGIQISEEDFIKIERAVFEKIGTKAAYNACGMMKALATITNSKGLAKAAEFSKIAIDFSTKINDVRVLMKNTAKLPLDQLSMALSNPTLAVATLALQVFGFFRKSGPTMEQMMLKELREISKQVADLHIDMAKSFVKVHKNLQKIHESLYKCSEDIKFLIANQVSGFRNDSIARLSKIDSTINSMQNLIIGNHYDLFTKSLHDLVTVVTDRMDGIETNNEKADVAKLAGELHAWLSSHSSSQGLNGMRLFKSGNTFDSHNHDMHFLNNNPHKLSNLLGYLVLLAQENNLNLEQSGTNSSISTTQIINPEIFNIAATEYTKLRRMFPTYVEDNEVGDKYKKIIDTANHTLNFISRVQKSDVLFKKLFYNYNLALAETKNALELRTVTANAEFQEKFVTKSIDLDSDYEELIERHTIKLPETFKPIPGTVCEDIQSKWLHDQNIFSLPPELFVAQQLKLYQAQGIFSAKEIIYPPEIDKILWSRHGIIQLQNVIVNDFNLSRTQGNIYEYSRKMNNATAHLFAKLAYKNWKLKNHEIADHNGYMTSWESHFQYEFTFTIMFGSEIFTRILRLNDKIGVRELIIKCLGGPQHPHHHIKTQFSLQYLLNQLVLQPSLNEADDIDTISRIKDAIKDTIVAHRKSEIAARLANSEDANFNNAILHLESAKRRLQAFAALAGFSESLQDRIADLAGRNRIVHELNEYISYGDFESPYWNEQDIDNLWKDCKQAIDNHTANPVFKSVIQNEIEKTTKMICLHQMIYKNTRDNPNAEIRTAKEKALDLGINLADLSTRYANFPIIAALIRAIIESNAQSLKFIFSNPIDLRAPLPGRTDLLNALHLAAYIGDIEMLNALCLRNKLVEAWNSTNCEGFTPLMFAVKSGELDAVKMITKIGVSLSLTNINNHTAEDLAQELNLIEIYDYLKSERERFTKNPNAYSSTADNKPVIFRVPPPMPRRPNNLGKMGSAPGSTQRSSASTSRPGMPNTM